MKTQPHRPLLRALRALFSPAAIPLAAALVLTLLAPRAIAAPISWDGGGDGVSWGDPNNWSGNVLPTATSDVTIAANAAAIQLGPVGAFTGLAQINSLNNGKPINIQSGGTLQVATTASSSKNITLSGGTIQGGALTLTGGATLIGTDSSGLNGVTVNGDLDLSQAGASVYVLNGLVLNGTMFLGAADGSTYGYVYFGDGTPGVAASLTGNAAVVFGGSPNNLILNFASGGPALTLGANVNIHGIFGYIYSNSADGNIINQGTINADTAGGTITLGNGTGTITNSGVMKATNGGNLSVTNLVDAKGLSVTGGGALSLQGTWANTGTITQTNSILNLGDTFTLASLGTISRTGGAVNITGTLNNTGTTLTLNAATGSWNLLGGTILGGTISTGTVAGGGSFLVLTNSTGYLNGVTVNGDLDLSQVAGASVYVPNGLVLNGTMFLGAADGSTYGYVYFGDGTPGVAASLTGNAAVVFGGSPNNLILNFASGGPALTLGANVNIHGIWGSISSNYADGNIINQGTINADTAGGTISVGGNGIITNSGVMKATNGGTLTIPSPISTNGSGVFSSDSGSSVNLSGDFLGNTTAVAVNNRLGTTTLSGTGPELLEAMSQDLGAVVAGLNQNFAYDTLVLGAFTNASVKLVNNSDNAPGAGAEAVYCYSVIVPSGTTLNLNGLHLYAHLIQVNGTVTGGTITPLADSGALTVAIVPAGAVIAGAKWQVDGGALQNSGAVVGGLSIGNHTVAFNTVSGYTTPASQIVTIAGGATTSRTGTYVATVNFTVTPSAGANGGISPNTAQSVGSGGSITFTATPNSGFTVNQWSLDGSAVQTGGTGYTLNNVTANHTVSVTFKAITFTVTPSAGANGTISPNTAQTVNSGNNITFTATPNSGFVVNQWALDGSVVQTGGATYTLNNVTANHAVSVSFAPATFTVTPSAGANGAISPNTAQTVNGGSNIAFTATPNSGYLVNQWSLDGSVVQTGGATYTLNNVTANHTVSVTFKLATFTVTPSAGANGAISPNTAQTVNNGSNITFTATPNSGFIVNQWSLDGSAVQTGGATYTLNNVTANHTVSVTFKVPTFTVTPSAGANGAISPNTAQTVNNGSNITFTATPNSGFIVNQWSLDGSAVQTGGTTYTLNNVTANHAVSVTFIATYTVTPSAGANGAISPNTVQTVNSGSNITFTATPNGGFTVNQWSLDGSVVQTGGATYTLNNVTANHTVSVSFKAITYTVTPSAGANGAISPNTVQTVNSGSNITFTATPISGFVVNQWSLDGSVVQTGGTTYTLNNVTANHAVSVSFKAATFTVTPSAGANGSINPNTVQTVNSGSNITFTATPNSGYVVNQWSLDGSVVQTGGATYTLNNVTANHTVSVSFKAITYTVTPSAGANGTISPNTVQTVNSGSNITFTATPNSGYAVNQWSLDGSVVQTGGATYTLNNVTANHTVSVTFAAISYTVTPSAGANGSINPNTPQGVNSGGSVTFTATPNSGYAVNQWSLDGSVVQTGGATYTLNNVTANHAVSVTFKTVTYTVTPSAGANGSISPNTAQTVTSGSNITFTATPNSGFVVNQWSLDGSAVQTGGTTYTLNNVTASHTVSVTFAATYTVTPSAGANGTISPNTAQTVNSGSNITFTATPNSGYAVNQWSLDGSVVQTGGATYTLNNVTANHTVSVTFAAISYTVTPSAGANGSISPNTPQGVNSGGSVTFTATPTSGYVVNQWSLDGGVVQTGGATYTLNNVTANHAVSVSFKAATFTVTPSAGANGTISPNTAQTVNSGSNITFTATPNSGYAVNQWSLDGSVVQTGGATYTLNNVTANHTVSVTFAAISYTVTPSAGANGSISPNTPQGVNSGGSVTFTATPNSGYTVNQWSLDGSVVQTGGATYTLNNVTASHAVSVTFKTVNYTVTPSAGANGSISPNTVQTVNSGSNITFTATPNSGYAVNQWSLDGSVVQTGGATYTLNNVTASHAVSVTFKTVNYTVTPSAGANGSISPNTPQGVNSGGNVTFTATPNSGYAVNQWSLDGSVVQTGGATYTLNNVMANHTVSVTFRAVSYTVTPGAGANGSISPNTAQTVNSGSNITFTATPNGGYAVNQWSLDGSAVQTGGTTYTLNNVTANRIVSVTFIATFAVTPSAGANGGISPNTTQTVKSGSSVTFTATPSSGYAVSQWSLDGSVVQTGGTAYTLSNVTANHTVSVTFTVAIASDFAGTYSGLATPTRASTNPARHVGLASVSVVSTGAFTGKLTLGGSTSPVSFAGTFGSGGPAKFGSSGASTFEIKRTGLPSLFLALNLKVEAPLTHRITGKLTENGKVVSELTLNRRLYTDATNPVPPLRNVPVNILDPATDKGAYTGVFKALPSVDPNFPTTAFPQGYGWSLPTVKSTGAVYVIGQLADGRAFAYTNYLSKDNVLPLYLTPYAGTGTVSGPVKFRDVPAQSDADGAGLRWFKPVNPSDYAYRAGWPNGLKTDFFGSKFVSPALTHKTLLGNDPATPPNANALLTLSNGGLAGALSNLLSINAQSKVTVLGPPSGGTAANGLGVALLGNGTFLGKFTHPASHLPTPFIGVVLQKTQDAGGYFLGSAAGSPAGSPLESGAATISAQ